MCGIAGVITRSPLLPEHVELAARMNQRLVHRGPDGAGHFEDRHVALAMRRLSIIDLSTGWQPLFNEDRSLALVCNGEIYNFVELRQQLEARGHRFATHSDCETILHLYEDHGDRCVDHLRGMFAFALWDTRKRRLLLARDRMGEKPLYIAQLQDRLVFASELRALVNAGAVPFALDPKSIFLSYFYGHVPEPLAAVEGVRKLPAAHTLSVDVDNWRIEQRCYWRLEDSPPLEGDPATLIREQLDRICEIVIRSDVPVGVALSGGLDSSVIATLAAKRYPGTMHAITVGYPGNTFQDERADARALAEYLKMPFHEVVVSTEEMTRALPREIFDCDDPITDLSGLSFYYVMRKARELGVPVMLAGNGGDELFWGYAWVRQAVRFTERKQALLSNGKVSRRDYLQLTKPPISYIGTLRWLRSLGGLGSGWKQYQVDRTTPPERMVFQDITPIFQAAARQLPPVMAPRFQEAVREVDPCEPFTHALPWPRIDIAIVRAIVDTYMMENGLAQGDRLSMAWSVELRQPLVDHQLVETVIGLRKTYPDLHLGPKAWFRQAVQDIVPEFVRRRRKRGFTPPWRAWRRSIAHAYGDQLRDGYLVEHGILSPQGGRLLAERVMPPRLGVPMLVADHSLILEMWCRAMTGAN